MLHRARDAHDISPSWDPTIVIPTLVGSLLSFLATTIVIICWIVFGCQKRSFRYALILNLTIAGMFKYDLNAHLFGQNAHLNCLECFNTLNNSISGLYVIIEQGTLPPGAACDVNGWVGQFTVQAVDFSILAISVVTLLTIQLKSYIIYASTPRKILICLSIWIIPLITSNIALGLNLIGPVSGNWCWIVNDRNHMRYVLTHGWRFAIIIITFCIYIHVFLFMHRRLRLRKNMSGRLYSFDYDEGANGFEMNFRLANGGPIDGSRLSTSSRLGDSKEIDPPLPQKAFAAERTKSAHLSEFFPPPRMQIRQMSNIDKDVWRMVLLNLYPVTYLILWLPGILNRIAEAAGHDIRALRILQSSTQYTGLANACVYGFREHWDDVKSWGRMVKS
ncbi:hypothetical protein K469DRAFT_590954 [Zopfia rhizophila CBS 207.26]|uniref:Glucose receptor Git3-like N-terminal domain-containing protein n=1 Tax=Zopfia rhizophila CBS 207.26 TaxID=1314779 RepID=A0A6A6DRP3_9PEZI|nr:hypothetical protein K469DRAFT_590954 [Zopfia rhizophila CBS 207.26]